MEKDKIEGRVLVLHIPVIHRGYLQVLKNLRSEIKDVYILDDTFIRELYEYEPSIASLSQYEVKKLLNYLGYKNIKILSKANLGDLQTASLVLIQDDISRNLRNRFFGKNDIEWESVFLRWDREKVLSEENLDVPISTDSNDTRFMKEAYTESVKSGDWWRQVGAVLVKEGSIILRAYNRSIPSDHTPYQVGNIRDYLGIGERPDLSPTVHAEQIIISEAARLGISTEKSNLYVTHFPCSVCAKLIANSGIKYCFFCEGSSNADGKSVLESEKVEVKRIAMN